MSGLVIGFEVCSVEICFQSSWGIAEAAMFREARIDSRGGVFRLRQPMSDISAAVGGNGV
jgi:hypothetical protein